MTKRITESELVLPMLLVLKMHGGRAGTSTLIKDLTMIMQPSGRDSEIIPTRKDTYFSQKVRNLKSHDTPQKLGVAKYDSRSWKITPKGEETLRKNKELLEYLITNQFGYEDVNDVLSETDKIITKKKSLEIFNENIEIKEGGRRIVKTAVYERSSKLRNFAIKHYSRDGSIACNVCDFDFFEFYGKIGEGYIEIHHIKPVYKYAEEKLEATIKKALENVVPLCSNCHRMIHRNIKSPLSVKALQSYIHA